MYMAEREEGRRERERGVERVGGEGGKHNLMQVLLSQAIQYVPSPSRAADYVTPSGCTELWSMLAMIPNWCRTAVSRCDASDCKRVGRRKEYISLIPRLNIAALEWE